MPNVLAVDPGSAESAYVLIDSACRPLAFDKCANHELLDLLPTLATGAIPVIELIGHYGMGMPAGRTVFDTCIWIGRYVQVLAPTPVTLTLRATIKTRLCGTPRANDGNVRQALVDRFAAGTGNHGKGSKAVPGFFYGFRADVWAAFALAVTHADLLSAACGACDADGELPLT